MPKLKIKEIKVKNFGSFINQSLELGSLRYPVMVLGDNGAGKTVFFVDSITYAFFGAAYERGNIGKDAVSRMHRGGGVEATIILESSDGALFEVTNKKVYRVNPRTEYPMMGVLTGHNFKTLLATYIVRQGKVANFLEITPRERRNYLLELLEYRFDKVRELVKEELDRIKDRMSAIENRLSEIEGMFKTLGVYEVSDEALEEALKSERSKKEELEREVLRYKEELDALRDELDSLKFRQKELNDLLKDIKKFKEISAKLEDVKKKLSKYYLEPDKLNDNILDELKSYVEKAVELLDSMEYMTSSRNDLNNLIGDYEMLLKEGDVKEIADLRGELNSLRERKGRISSEIGMYKDRINKLSKAGSTCPVCGSPLTEEHRNKIMKEAGERIEELEKEMGEVEKEIKRIEGEIKRLEKLDRKLREMIGKIGRILEEASKNLGLEKPKVDETNLVGVSLDFMARIDREAKRLGRDFTNLLGKMDKLGFKTAPLTSGFEGKTFKEVKRMLKEYLDMVESLYRDMSKHLELFQSYEERVKGLDEEGVKREIDELESKIKELNKRREDVEKRYREFVKAVGEVDARIKALEGLKEHLDSYREYKEKLSALKDEYEIHRDLDDIFKEGGFPTYLINEVIIPKLNEYTNNYLEEFNTNFRVRFVVKGTTIDVKVFEGDNVRILDSLSGGEMTLIGLAFRLAFGRLIALLGMNYVFDFIILDEALTHLDERNKRIVAERLVRMVEDGVISQVIIITHDRTIQELPFMTGTVVKVDKPGLVSRIILADKEGIEV